MVPPICPTMSTATTIRSGLAQILHRQHTKPSLRWGVCTVSSSFQDSYRGATGQHHVICSPHAHRRRWQSSDSTAGTPDIPAPTWSVSNLRLKADPSDPDDTISEEELYKLAYRCLIDVRTLPQEERDALRRDLAGIMRCVSVVSDTSQQLSESMEGDVAVGSEELYDAFRGQYSGGSLLRDDSRSNDNGDDEDSMENWSGREEAQQILKNALNSGKKSIRKDEDGDTYFSVTTGGGDNSGADK